MRRSRPARRTIRFAVLAACLGPLAARAAMPAPDAAARSSTLHLPDVQVHGADGLAERAAPVDAPHAPAGQEGFGDSVVELQSLDGRDGDVDIVVSNKADGDRVATLSRPLQAGGATAVDLARVDGIGFGDFSAALDSDVRFGAVARTRWPNGAVTAYRAPEAGTDLVVPLIVANVLGQATVFSVRNGSPVNVNPVEVKILDNAKGGTVLTISEVLDPSQTASWDTFLDQSLFAPPALPDNAHGGYVGSLRITAREGVATLAYGDQIEGKGSSAYVARPAAAADAVQHLPLVRAGADGASLIGIANVENRAVDVTVTYRAMGAAGAPKTQTFGIGPRGTAVVDLGDRGRGTVAAPSLGTFTGSASIRATGPVLAASVEDHRTGEAVDGIAAYNAFGPADLGTRLGVPVVRRATQYATTALVVFNPGPEPARVTIDLLDAEGRSTGSHELDVPEGGVSRLGLGGVPSFLVGTGRAVVVASQPVAVLAYDERDTSVKPEPQPVRVKMVEIMGSGVSGTATLTQNGAAVDVEIRMDGGGNSDASLNEGTCSLTPGRELHALAAIANGYSFTQLPRTKLEDLATGTHSIRTSVQGLRGGRRQMSCGIIPYVAGPEDADLAVAEALVIEAGEIPPTATATTPPTTPPTAPPRATATPVGPEPTPVPTVTTVPGGTRLHVYLPIARLRE